MEDYRDEYLNEVQHAEMNTEANAEATASMKKTKRHSGRKVAAWILAGAMVIGAAGGGVAVGKSLAVREGTTVAAATETGRGTMSANGTLQAAVNDTDSGNAVTLTVTGGHDDSETPVATVTDVSGVVENVMPSIVSIDNMMNVQMNFWGRIYTQQAGGSGSGIIIGQNDQELLIVTNNHVIAEADGATDQTLTVTFGDETTAPAKVVGAASSYDLAVISVDLSEVTDETKDYIKVATLGNSDELKVGQMAIAIGNALGYGQSTTVGYISALNREMSTEDYTLKLIQTDAAINPGNSGGALLNIYGEVIGINSAKYSDESVEGMGFAIPISTAIPIIENLMTREQVAEEDRAYLGIVGNDVTENFHKTYGLPIGVYVVEVAEDSPAEKAGLKMGDVITGFNGMKITSMEELQEELAYQKAGSVITLNVSVYNAGKYKEKTVTITLGARSEVEGLS